MPTVLLCAELEVREEDRDGYDGERNDNGGEGEEAEGIVCTRGEDISEDKVQLDESRA